MSKLKLGIDCDGVLSNYGKMNRKIFFQHYDIDVPENPPSWDYTEKVVGEEKWTEFWERLVLEYEAFYRMPPYENNVEALQDLLVNKDAPEVHIITKVPESCIHHRLKWLTCYFPAIPEERIHILGKDESKGKLKMDAYLDDYEENIEEIAVANPGSLVVLHERSWNASFETEHENVLSVDCLYAFLDSVSEWEKSGLSAKEFVRKNFPILDEETA